MKRDPLRYFRIEARELLEHMHASALNLESGVTAAQLQEVLRFAHTLKGAARVVKQRDIADLAHAFEDILAPYREHERPVARAHVSQLLATLDAIGQHLAQLPAADDETAAAPGAAPSDARATPAPATESARAVRTVRADVADVDALLDGLGEAQAELAALHDAGADAERARGLAATLAMQLSPLRDTDARRASPAAPGLARARTLADDLHRTISGIERGVGRAVERIDRELRQAREQTEHMRLVAAGIMFAWLQRLVRESADGVGKCVTFHGRGAGVRLDSDVLDAVQTALVQMSLNAVVHGIETAEERRDAGKPAEGQITLDVSRHGNHIVFSLADDGRGVDLDAVRAALHRKGALPPDAAHLDSAELLRTLLKGGISTARTVTGMAGRGVGLDVVREVTERLGGTASARTAAGVGTTIELRVPASLVSLEALVVEAGGERVAIPLEAVRATQRVDADGVLRTASGNAVAWEDRVIPLAPLAALLRSDARPAVRDPRARHRATSMVVVGDGEAVAAVAVDKLAGSTTIVLRSLPPLAPAAPIVGGIYVDSDGSPRTVLDAVALARAAGAHRAEPAAESRARLPILVIDDSLTTRMLERSILESAGYEVVLATSAEQGLDVARQGRYGLVLVDVEMPGMDGFTFVAHLRADPVLRDTPCLLVTSRDAPEDRARGAAAGADGYIVKTAFDQVEFLRRVTELLER